MKRLLCIAALTACMTLFAPAANVGTIGNEYPGDTEAQAQMLCDLGLFRGTDKGFELEKPMTRAEAAVMLTRLLGAEDEALAGTRAHPFYDVPAWADSYVGWLYENGLTKGVSATQYGARQKVTCGQYCIFLSRALNEQEDGITVADDAEIAACDAAGFVRGDAVSLSARALDSAYTVQKPTSRWLTLAAYLMEQGVFTTEELKDAAWDVLPRAVQWVDENGEPFGAEGDLCCVIAGVPVLRNTQTDVRPDRDLCYETGREYGYNVDEKAGRRILYLIDPETLETTRLFDCAVTESIDVPYSTAQRDYFRAGTRLLSVVGTAVKLEKITFNEKDTSLVTASDEQGRCAFACEQGICVLDGDTVRTIGESGIGMLYGQIGGLLITEDIGSEQTEISAWTWDGAAAGQYTAVNDYPPEYQERWNLCAELTNKNEPFLWGSVGLYQVENGWLRQLTDRAVYDCAVDQADGSIVAITREKGSWAGSFIAGLLMPAGNEVMRIAKDGTQTMLLTNTPAHGLNLTQVSYAEDGAVRVVHSVIWGMQDLHAYEYAVENGKLRALYHEGGAGFSGYTEEERKAEQQRLDALGVGVGAA